MFIFRVKLNKTPVFQCVLRLLNPTVCWRPWQAVWILYKTKVFIHMLMIMGVPIASASSLKMTKYQMINKSNPMTNNNVQHLGCGSINVIHFLHREILSFFFTENCSLVVNSEVLNWLYMLLLNLSIHIKSLFISTVIFDCRVWP